MNHSFIINMVDWWWFLVDNLNCLKDWYISYQLFTMKCFFIFSNHNYFFCSYTKSFGYSMKTCRYIFSMLWKHRHLTFKSILLCCPISMVKCFSIFDMKIIHKLHLNYKPKHCFPTFLQYCTRQNMFNDLILIINLNSFKIVLFICLLILPIISQ